MAIEKVYKEFKGEGYTVLAHPRSCFFCRHCTDIFYDYTNGPYMFICDIDSTSAQIESGLRGECGDFEEEN